MNIYEKRLTAVNRRLAEIKNDPARQREFENQEIPLGDVTMKYSSFIENGSSPNPPENGYPIFIALHGGGGAPTPDMNNSQWEHMKRYYRESLKTLADRGKAQGIYIAVRGVRDTWDTHANPESYPLYVRLIENFAANLPVDMNRIYITGFSAGGDGVYLITSALADRFAAANMSAGHNNGIKLTNLRNMPIQLQVGEVDTAYNRHKVTAEYDGYLTALSETYGGYTHNTFIHRGKPHNFRDNDPAFGDYEVYVSAQEWLDKGEGAQTTTADTNALSFLTKFKRTPLPDRITRDFSMNPPMCEDETGALPNFYWLGCDASPSSGIADIEIIKKKNAVIIHEINGITADAKLFVYANEEMFDFAKPVTITDEDEQTRAVTISCDNAIIEQTAESADINRTFAAKIEISKRSRMQKK